MIRSGGTSSERETYFGSQGNDQYIFDGAGRQAKFFLGYESETDPVSITINSFENTGTAVWMGGVDLLTNISGALSSDIMAENSGYLALGGTNADDQFNITLRPDDYQLIFPRDGADSISLDAEGAGAVIIYTFGLGTQADQGLQINLGELSVQNDGFGNSEQIQLTGTPEEFGIQGTNNADTVITGGMDEFFFLLDGDDSLTAGTGGDDSVDGGDGTDTVFVNHTLGTSTVTFAEGLSTLVDRNGPAASTEMREVEFIAASDGNLELAKHDGIGLISAADLTALTELYIAYFDRAADALGLSFWATAFQKNGFSLREIADQFFTQPETQALYSGVSDGDFVTAVYNNVLGRDPDTAGFEFWTGQLSAGNVSESGFILELLAGACAQTGDPADVAYIEAKTDIGLYFAVTQGQNNLDDARAVMDTFNGSENSVTDAIAVADAAYQEALASTDTLLMPVVGVIESPFDGVA